jgi:hypothetical protein
VVIGGGARGDARFVARCIAFGISTLILSWSLAGPGVCFPAQGFAEPASAFGYEFENRKFYISKIQVDVAADAKAVIHFQRGESDELIDLNVELRPETLARIRQLYDTLDFLSSNEEYQNKKDFSHLGWVTIYERRGERGRRIRFNYSTNVAITELADIFRGIATQEIRLFDIDLAEQHQPLDLPAQLEALENELRLERITEPERLLGPLQEIADGETAPLIGRNHARRLIDAINKKKFKTPIKK